MKYRNLDGTGPNATSAVFRWMVTDNLSGRRRKSPPTWPAMPRVAADLTLLRTPPLPGEPPRITWIGHASFLVQVDGLSILIDPVFPDTITGFIKRNVPAAVQPAQLPPIDATLITHSHYDHLDLRSVKAAGAKVISGEGLLKTIAMPGAELGWWKSHALSATVRVVFVPSQHWSRRTPFDTNESLWGGFIIESSKARIYHSGDTAYFEGFKEIGRRFPGIDAALLPIGAYDPAWFMERQHMNPEQAAQAFSDLGARTFIAMHWGTFKLTDEPLDEPPRRLRAEWARRGLQESALRIVAIGETVAL